MCLDCGNNFAFVYIFLKLIKLYVLNIHSLLYANFTYIELLKKCEYFLNHFKINSLLLTLEDKK